MNRRITRRDLIKYGALGLGSLAAGGGGLYSLMSQGVRTARADDDEFRTPIKFTPFTRALPVPPTKAAGTPFTPQNCAQLVVIRSGDRKSTRLNSSHGYISYAVFCFKKKKD